MKQLSRRKFLGTSLTGLAGVQAVDALGAETPSASSFDESARSLPIVDTCDVIVCGGGPAGFSAAVTAARQGAKVRLFEVNGCLGGVWTSGLLTYVFDADKPGITKELITRLEEREAIVHNRQFPGRFTYEPEEMKVLLEKLAIQSGVKVQLHTRIVAAYKDRNNKVDTLVTESKSGRQAWRAHTVIDATGDGDVGALAGCEFEIGERASCPCQPMTLNALVVAEDADALYPYTSFMGGDGTHRGKPVRELLRVLKEAGIDFSYSEPTLFQVRGTLFTLMINHEYAIEPWDAAKVSEASIRARAEIYRVVRGLRKLGGPWKGLQIASSGEHIGIRDGRRIKGRYFMTKENIVSGSSHADGIAKVTFNVDIHAPTRELNDINSTIRTGIKVQPYDIPLRALIARDVDGLMMAGRCISGDYIAHSSYRVTGNATAMGEAAGLTSAMASQKNQLPHQLDSRSVLQALEEIRRG